MRTFFWAVIVGLVTVFGVGAVVGQSAANDPTAVVVNFLGSDGFPVHIDLKDTAANVALAAGGVRVRNDSTVCGNSRVSVIVNFTGTQTGALQLYLKDGCIGGTGVPFEARLVESPIGTFNFLGTFLNPGGGTGPYNLTFVSFDVTASAQADEGGPGRGPDPNAR